ncbi:MAG: SRPBCC domain-containing protein [Cyclobacteriaceae bacterium]|nr:SRPBCC domain-containing protein [Cyclobacteriaceae bacterium]
MPDIFHQFRIEAQPQKVFDAFCSQQGLNDWWTARSSGVPKAGEVYTFWFGPEYDWRATVAHVVPGREITWQMTQAMDDWVNTRVGIRLTADKEGTLVDFFHEGWREANPHFRISNFCWGTLLTGLKNYVERGTVIPFDQRQ